MKIGTEWRRRNWMILPALLAGLTGCAIDDMSEWGNSQKYKEDFRLSYPLQAGGTLSLSNFNGSIEIAGWEKDEVEVNGVKYAASEDKLAGMRIEADSTAGSLRLRTVKPDGASWNCGAKYIVRVPARVRLQDVETSNGSVKVEGLTGTAKLRTSNGSVKVLRHEGLVEARTSNGSIQGDIRGARDGRLMAKTSNGSIDISLPDFENEEVDFSTSNGSITLRLPGEVNASLRASTSNARVTSDFDVQGSGTSGKNRLEGNLGKGGATVRLSTSNGAIRVQRL
jgi:DUF4097 and DUF4098 domain-containing protein YvlB